MGQCNDAYSAIVVATELAKALKTDVNSLPLSLDLSWFEQKAVVVLLSLLHLGVRNIRLGPRCGHVPKQRDMTDRGWGWLVRIYCPSCHTL